jgi:hypothetical protein
LIENVPSIDQGERRRRRRRKKERSNAQPFLVIHIRAPSLSQAFAMKGQNGVE